MTDTDDPRDLSDLVRQTERELGIRNPYADPAVQLAAAASGPQPYSDEHNLQLVREAERDAGLRPPLALSASLQSSEVSSDDPSDVIRQVEREVGWGSAREPRARPTPAESLAENFLRKFQQIEGGGHR